MYAMKARVQDEEKIRASTILEYNNIDVLLYCRILSKVKASLYWEN